MAKLFDLAKAAWRRITQRRSTLPPGGMKSTPGAPPIQPGPRQYPANVPRPGAPSQPSPPPPVGGPPVQPPTAPPVQPPVQPPSAPIGPSPQDLRDIEKVEEVYSEIQLLGRDRGHSDDMQAVMDQMRRVASSNVYGYFFELEGGYSQRTGKHAGKTAGILYVTFLGQLAGGARSNGPGSTYAYYDVPVSKFEEFQSASESSAGKAVWDYLRVRGTSWEHQHRYRLVQVAGDYIPRKATRAGFQTRRLIPPGQPKIPNAVWAALSRLEASKDPKVREYGARMRRELLQQQNFRRSTLAPRTFLPNRGTPNRGRPNRG